MAEKDIIDYLLEDHHLVRELCRQLSNGQTTQSRGDLFRTLVEQLARHETAEEMILYPRLRKEVEGGDVLADARLSEEHHAEEMLAELERLDPGSDEFMEKLEQLKAGVLEHAENEEQQVFPRLREALSAEDLQTMGKMFEAAKKMAPTHPHPDAPDTPPGNIALGPIVAVFDRARDAIKKVMSSG
jgi:hemerythrin superfamily protein